MRFRSKYFKHLFSAMLLTLVSSGAIATPGECQHGAGACRPGPPVFACDVRCEKKWPWLPWSTAEECKLVYGPPPAPLRPQKPCPSYPSHDPEHSHCVWLEVPEA